MKFSSTLARCFALVATLTTVGTTTHSFAHAVLTEPQSRDGADGNKTGPCGTAVIKYGANNYTPGQSLTVKWNETVNHPGCFVVEWSKDNNATFTNLATVKHTTVGATPRPYSTTVTLPTGDCQNCTLRLIQHMLSSDALPCPPATPAAGSLYFSCAQMVSASADLGVTPGDLAVVPADMATPPPTDGGSMSTGCNFPGQAASSAGGLMVLVAALGLLRRRRSDS